MRSAFYYPEAEVSDPATMASALLLWDELHVIVPDQKWHPSYYQNPGMQAAWEVFGKTKYPSDAQKKKAHESILELMDDPDFRAESGERVTPRPYTIYPSKLMDKTWTELRDAGLFDDRGDAGAFENSVAVTVMSKLADACAGSRFSRWTDVRSANEHVFGAEAIGTKVVPFTLSLVDMSSIPLAKVIAFRRREQAEARGHDLRALRHAYCDAVSAHIEALRGSDSPEEASELSRQFRQATVARHKDLIDGLSLSVRDMAFSPVVTSVLTGVGSWLATNHGVTSLALAACAGAPAMVDKVMSLHQLGRGASAKQRQVMAGNPMAYVQRFGRET